MDLFTKIPSLKEFIEKNQYSEALNELNKLLDVEKENYDAYIFKASIYQLMNKEQKGTVPKMGIGQNNDVYLELCL